MGWFERVLHMVRDPRGHEWFVEARRIRGSADPFVFTVATAAGIVRHEEELGPDIAAAERQVGLIADAVSNGEWPGRP
jgi:hypothetical protein